MRIINYILVYIIKSIYIFSKIVLFTVTGIKSNLFLTEQQIITYLLKLGVYEDYKDCLTKWLSNVHRDSNNSISINSFSRLLLSYPGLSYPIFYVRNFIIEKVIGYSEWNRIIRRRNYFNRVAQDPSVVIPNESCLSILKRTLVTHNPPPFHCDYKPLEFNKVESFNSLLYKSGINEIRKRYGYSSRPERMSCSGSLKLSCSNGNSKNRASLNSLVNLSSVDCI